MLLTLRIIHEAGYVYNDIKLENIMVKPSKSGHDLKVVLIDFGMAQKYTDEDGEHLNDKEMSKFGGNLIFSSYEVLNFRRPSRRDDLIMLSYFLIYLLNGAEMPLLDDFLPKEEVLNK